MRTLKFLVLLLALSLPAWGLTNNGVSAPIQGVGVANTDCPAAIANSGPANGGTNGKAVALQLPSWASSADIDISGTFVGTWNTSGSIDNVVYRNFNALTGTNYLTSSNGTAGMALSTQAATSRYICVYLSVYTSGTVVVTMEPRSTPIGQYLMLGTSGSFGGTTASAGVSVAQATASTSNLGQMVVAVGDKSVFHAPAAATIASASIAAGGATVRHIGTSCTVSISTVAAQPSIVVNLRDGASGAGTILWSGYLTCPIGANCVLQTQPINLVGSGNTAMTCETAIAPAAGNTAIATLTYHDAG